MQYQFYTCDVFTENRFGGNQLAVLPNASGLTTEQMQLIAREFNFSESTFVFPAEKGNTRKVRIFTRQQELPFAGHPNIGTAFVLEHSGALNEERENNQIIFEEKAGLVTITIHEQASNQTWYELKAPESLTLGEKLSVKKIATILSLTPDEIKINTHMPQQASVGLPFILTELKNHKALEKIAVNSEALRNLEEGGIFPALYVYIHRAGEFDIQGRMFAPLGGTIEDPATGSANCALAGLLTHYHAQDEGQFSWRIAQGVEMQRPSVLNARAQKQGGVVTGVWVGGNCVMVSKGQIEV